MSDRQFERSVHDWLEDGSDRTPPAAIEAVFFAVKTTPQQRDLGILRRYTRMPNSLRYAAAAAIVAVIGFGALTYFGGDPGVGTEPTGAPNASPTTSPTRPATVTTAPLEVAPGITGWTTYTSAVHGFTIGYPEHWNLAQAAAREWQPGDTAIEAIEARYADIFESTGEDTIGLFVWEMPAGEGADVESVEGLKAWAESFCNDVADSTCEGFTQPAESMCLNVGGDACRAAILVPTPEGQYAFFVDWESAVFTGVPDRVRVVLIGREDRFPAAARYGGSVQLLRSILTEMDVHPR